MKIHRFYIKEKIGNSAEITLSDPELIHQIKNVLRLKVSETIQLFDDFGDELDAKIEKFESDSILVSGGKKESSKVILNSKSRSSKVKIKLALAVIKKDKYEWVAQKCTEIGVVSFIPIISERTEKMNLNKERLEKIIKEAAEQSDKNYLATLVEPIKLEDFLAEKHDNVFALDFCETLIDVSQIKELEEATFLVGPEGGWGESDLELFEKYNVPLVSLGEQVLRAETAAVAVASLTLLG